MGGLEGSALQEAFALLLVQAAKPPAREAKEKSLGACGPRTPTWRVCQQYPYSMRAVIQRVTEASVTVDDQVVGQIGFGLLVLLGVGASDGPAEAGLMAEKIANMRIFPDE